MEPVGEFFAAHGELITEITAGVVLAVLTFFFGRAGLRRYSMRPPPRKDGDE